MHIISRMVQYRNKKVIKIHLYHGRLPQTLLAAVTCICDRCGVSCGELAGAGVGIGSYIFREGGTVDSTWGYIPCLDGVALEEEIQSRIGVSCVANNDLRAIALAESKVGAGKAYDRVLSITLGTGGAA